MRVVLVGLALLTALDLGSEPARAPFVVLEMMVPYLVVYGTEEEKRKLIDIVARLR